MARGPVGAELAQISEEQRPSVAERVTRFAIGAAFGVAGFVETFDGVAALNPIQAAAGVGSVVVSYLVVSPHSNDRH